MMKPSCADVDPMHVFTAGEPTCQCGGRSAGPEMLRFEAHYAEAQKAIACELRELTAKMVAVLAPEERALVATLAKIQHEKFLEELHRQASSVEVQA